MVIDRMDHGNLKLRHREVFYDVRLAIELG